MDPKAKFSAIILPDIVFVESHDPLDDAFAFTFDLAEDSCESLLSPLLFLFSSLEIKSINCQIPYLVAVLLFLLDYESFASELDCFQFE